MTEDSLQGRERLAATYLEQLLELASEISAAAEAISANRMQDFRECVDKQEMLCAGLASMVSLVGGFMGTETSDRPQGVDPMLAKRIRAACKEIKNLNFKYEALLKHSGRSIVQLSLLCKSQTGQVLSAFPSKHQTWSCEV